MKNYVQIPWTAFLIILTLTGCKDTATSQESNGMDAKNTHCEDDLKAINEQLNAISIVFGKEDENDASTKPDCAIDTLEPVCYNTITGLAYYSLTVPKNMMYQSHSKSGQKVIYHFVGTDVNESATKIYPCAEGGFSKKPGEKLTIIVCMRDSNKTDTQDKPFVEKHKKSVIEGEPVAGGCISEVTCETINTCE